MLSPLVAIAASIVVSAATAQDAPPPAREPNAADDYRAAVAELTFDEDLPDAATAALELADVVRGVADADRKAATAWLQRNAAALDRVRLASTRPICTFARQPNELFGELHELQPGILALAHGWLLRDDGLATALAVAAQLAGCPGGVAASNGIETAALHRIASDARDDARAAERRRVLEAHTERRPDRASVLATLRREADMNVASLLAELETAAADPAELRTEARAALDELFAPFVAERADAATTWDRTVALWTRKPEPQDTKRPSLSLARRVTLLGAPSLPRVLTERAQATAGFAAAVDGGR